MTDSKFFKSNNFKRDINIFIVLPDIQDEIF